jgi:membrane protease YdiL (CAAX protease family)
LLLGTVVILRHFNLPLSQTSNRGRVWLVLTAGATLGAAGGLMVGGTPPTALAPEVGSIAQYLYAFAWVGIAAPLIEELFFRGVLQQTLLRPPASVVTILIPAALFMTAHLGGDPLSLYFLLGLGFGIIAYAGGSVWPAVAAHIAWNTASILVGVFPSVAQSARPVLTVGTLATLVVGACWLRGGKRR